MWPQFWPIIKTICRAYLGHQPSSQVMCKGKTEYLYTVLPNNSIDMGNMYRTLRRLALFLFAGAAEVSVTGFFLCGPFFCSKINYPS